MTSFWPGATVLFLVFASLSAAEPGGSNTVRQVYADKGIQVVFEAAPEGISKNSGKPFQEGDSVRFRFTATDSSGKAPLRGANMRAWLDLRRAGEIPAANAAGVKAARFLTGGIFGQAALDLNSFYVLALNSDATISVVDPLFGFGSTKLLALIPLSANGYDWVMTRDQSKLFVSIPEKGQIAVIDTGRWEVSQYIEAGLRPTRLALQPDEQYLWAIGGGKSQSSAAAFRTDSFALAAKLPVGRGGHDIAMTGNSAFVFVTNGEDDSVSVIDTRALAKVKEIKVGRGPVAATYSELAEAVYVCAEHSGDVTVLDAKRLEAVKTLQAKPGLAHIATAPGGRHVLVVNTKANTVQVIDTSSAEIIQTGTVGEKPFQISFSRDLAYINHLGTAEIFMLPLGQIGRSGQPLSVVTFSAGRQPLSGTRPDSPASRIVSAPAEGAVLVAGTRDCEVFYYKEGMAAPMGSFTNYSREPLAVQVVDRSLRERGTPGVYETVAKLGAPGTYDVLIVANAPKILHSFELTVAPNPALEAARNTPKVVIAPVIPDRPARAGESAIFRFRVADKQTNEPITGLRDIMIVVMAPDNWNERQVAREEGGGVYSVSVTPPRPGVYYAHAQCLSRNVDFGNSHYPILRIAPGSSAEAAAAAKD